MAIGSILNGILAAFRKTSLFLPIASILVLSLTVVSGAYAAQSAADQYKQLRNYEGALLNKPIFDSASKSYFELIKTGTNYNGSLRVARSQVFNGVRGRLAVISSSKTQEIIDRVLRPDSEAWIGLRMGCSRRALFWSNGVFFNRSKDYRNWGPNKGRYARKYQPCKFGERFAGIVLTPLKHAGYRGESRRWFAISHRHAVRYTIVEYPTGGQIAPPQTSKASP